MMIWTGLIAGIAGWTLMEYAFHRWLGHDPRFRPNFFSKEHIRHHSKGNYFSAVSFKLRTALMVLAVLTPLAVWVAGVAGAAFSVGLTGMYLVYEWFHWQAHASEGATAYGRRMRRHHFFHHFEDPKSNHGVTTPIWDWVFGTYRSPSQIRVPAKLKMRWLVDPETGGVRATAAQWYALRGRG
ncbi:MAG: sterol desaturase family protein [Bradymonadia bacterium]